MVEDELANVEFVVDELVTSVDQLNRFRDTLKEVDGILAIHLTLWIMPILNGILQLGRPTVVFSAPYSGHEWHTPPDVLRGHSRGASTFLQVQTNPDDK